MSTLASVHNAHRLAIFRQGLAEPLLVQHAPPDARPYVHPLAAPSGFGVLTEDTPPHHPWQHGLYVGLNDVNGVGFWTEGLNSDTELDGTFHPAPLMMPTIDDDSATWQIRSEWRSPLGVPMLDEQQSWQLMDHGDTLVLDMVWKLQAHIDITFGRYAYGGLFLRMPYQAATGGQLLSSEGCDRQTEAEAQRARWIAVCMPIAGLADDAGIAMMDHPENPGHPNPWRVDSQLGIAPSRCITGPWQLANGQYSTNRYRLFAFEGDIEVERIESAWRDFTGQLR
ncbi:MAG: PmoA family protein [Gemmatimonadetes bacterium]|jgi:hypothetical protein|nr:PmoA family protein [Gemmatimonadota bacterium]